MLHGLDVGSIVEKVGTIGLSSGEPIKALLNNHRVGKLLEQLNLKDFIEVFMELRVRYQQIDFPQPSEYQLGHQQIRGVKLSVVEERRKAFNIAVNEALLEEKKLEFIFADFLLAMNQLIEQHNHTCNEWYNLELDYLGKLNTLKPSKHDPEEIHTVLNLSNLPELKVRNYINNFSGQEFESIELKAFSEALKQRYQDINIQYIFDDCDDFEFNEYIFLKGKSISIKIEKFQNNETLKFEVTLVSDNKFIGQDISIISIKNQVFEIISFVEIFKHLLFVDTDNSIFLRVCDK